MKKILALLTLLAAPAFAQDRYPAASRPTCTVGSPRAVMLFKQTDEDDCDATNSGTADAYCECKCTDRTDPLTCEWTPVSEGTGGGPVGVTDIVDDASCNPLDVVQRNAGDTAFECAAGGGGSLTHPQAMARVSLGF